MKKEWKTPVLETLDINMTMASGYEGYHDEAYNGEPANGPHHQS
ncbi:paeninodin family lasso peptide [Bacillus mycoides]|uniref:Paeninodin family lasso peptide n=1 Tax=Bacillus cereus MC67 TaxID=1053219 RepID=J8EKR4_BACCE|nr:MULTISPECIES: paeninodin family lasso peptide [Bacillus cereus group]EJQ97586.1 hypothetical protein II3_03980 [Bacillus cereus MC67]EOP17088.1 hypothetical protein II1_01800 [Bacillus cereus MC118]MDM5463585.1 paeninodin family lasso peptide [Bacillus cereus]QWH38578.1 paeninodin family lasso peptide [Bacillus mycoides]QWI50646.1 paeninodin family lasso peptide [Bacillus mycoides]